MGSDIGPPNLSLTDSTFAGTGLFPIGVAFWWWGGIAATARICTVARRVARKSAQWADQGGSRPTQAAKTEVAHPGVDHLRPPRRGPVAAAVAVGTEERSALDHLARHP